MNTLTVWTFDGPDLAGPARDRLAELARLAVLTVDDVALLRWDATRRTPVVRDLGALTGPGALWHGFWPMVLGLVFVVPVAGLAFGAGAAAVAGSLTEFGMDEAFILDVRRTVVPGTSALFVLSDAGQVDVVARALRSAPAVEARLSDEEAWRLRTALAEDEQSAPRA
jgi:uncharacterized membrane protein